jgi:hypothetical protein
MDVPRLRIRDLTGRTKEVRKIIKRGGAAGVNRRVTVVIERPS